MKNILIVMEPSIRSEQLQRQLSGAFCVACCENGMDALEMMMEFEPDILVVDLMLSDIDGISMLEHIWNGGYRPSVVAITPYISDYIVTALERMGVSCLLRGSCGVDQLVARTLDIANTQAESVCKGRDIPGILVSLGFKMNTSGFLFTQCALEYMANNPNQKITSQLYPAVAKACNGTETQVEKAIRGCIDSAWENRNDRIWQMYFSTGKNGKTSKPSNGQFLARITQCIANQDQGNSIKRKIG